MSDRFYIQQLNSLGVCPGSKNKKRNRRMPWTDEKKAAVVAAYEASEPTPETSMEIATEIADEYDESPNGVRMILIKAGVYVKKTAVSKGSGEAKGTRVSKQDAQDALCAALESANQVVDEDIISKLTGKAAQYFTGVVTAVSVTE
jgi:hypothetical protein